ncbi:MAG: hypothetical protein JWN96_1926, partial [Mycobacterium sp.]|nr:hypothetical protein [Mycobacterium sp.]
RQRPDAAVPPPADFELLANRLSSRHSVSRAAENVDTFVLEILEALVVSPASEQELADFCRAAIADVERAAGVALRLGVAWRDEHGRLTPVYGVKSSVGEYPLGLGRPFAALIKEVPLSLQRQIRDDLDLAADHEGEAADQTLIDFFSDPEALGKLIAGLNDPERHLLTALTRGSPVGIIDDGRDIRIPMLAEAESGVESALARGLVIAISRDTVELPREVGLAVRGDRPAGELKPKPPELGGREVGREQVDAGGAAAALDVLRLFEALLERWDAAPPPLTRAGGLPVRELRGAAKDLGIEQDTVALLVQTVVAASLAGRTPGIDPVMVPTERYDRWRDEPLAVRWALLVTAWAGMDQLPGLAVNPDGTKAAALLTYEMVRPGAGEMRRDVLAGLAAAGVGRAPDPAGLPAWLGWRAPTRSAGSVVQVTEWTLAEAQLLGVTGRGALTSAGRLLVESPDAAGSRMGDEIAARAYREAVADAMAPALPEPIEHVVIQADLTAVAPGPLRPPIARELALVADVESSGAATVYRFSDASLRRAFDAGRTATDLHQMIERLARGTVPQGLSYLIDDIARRHGRLRAGTAGSYLRSDDTGLLAEVVANKRTAAAALVLVAPTVAISPHDPQQVLAALRNAGYAPAGDAGGKPGGRGVELTASDRRRVPVVPMRTQAVGWAGGAALPDSHVTQTVAMLRRVYELRRSGGSRLPSERPEAGEVARTPESVHRMLLAAATSGGAVWIGYVNKEGRRSQRTVHPTMVSGGFVIGLDDETGERRTFALSLIQEARSAG